MSEFIFTSPGVKFREKDLTFVTREIGTTFLGLVGETEKGPAFEPIKIEDKTLFRKRLGNQSIKRFPNGELQYQLPYVANAFLDESNELYVTRVLGLSGYESGNFWGITLDSGPDLNNSVSGSTDIDTYPFTGGTYTITEEAFEFEILITADGQTGGVRSEPIKSNGSFSWFDFSYRVIDYNPITGDGDITITKTPFTADELEDYQGMLLCVLRSRGYVEDVVNDKPVTTHHVSNVTIDNNNTNVAGKGDFYGSFDLVVTYDGGESVTYNVSLNPSASNFISKVLGEDGKDKTAKLWVEFIYTDTIRKLDREGIGFAVNNVLSSTDVPSEKFYNEYTKTKYKTPETPWVVSQIRGEGGNEEYDKLFKLISISDGKSANKEIKISILNINPITGEFDVFIRDFNDTDNNINVLESYTRCTLREKESSFIAKRIGSYDGTYSLRSNYVMVEMGETIEDDSFPCGFEGYYLNKFNSTVIPKMFYKTEYDRNENINRTFLGISETGYDGRGISQNMFNYAGFSENLTETEMEYFEKTLGFHLDSDANSEIFDVGIGRLREVGDILDPIKPYHNENTRKFTLVPYGGFDGWDIHRDGRTHGDFYMKGNVFDGVEINETPTNDFQAWETAMATFSNPLDVYINLFATPGINWLDNSELIKKGVQMIETERSDSLYIIDSPDINIPQTIGMERNDVLVSKTITESLNSINLDSSYSCTYYPWIQIRDVQNGVNVYIPPTGEVVAAMAFTDKVKFPWFAPAGLQRGVTNARKSKYRLSSDARRILYTNRINPIADFANTGTAIFGQKTLQVRESALDRINVRRLLLQIKLLISNIAVRLVFEQNDQTTIDEFLSKATPVLDTIKRERGLYDFKIKMDDSINTPETRDRNELYGEIYLKPTRSVEYIGITFNITPSGASFEDV